MANTRSGNVWHVDTAYSMAADDLSGSFIVPRIVVTATANSGTLVLKDPTTGDVKIEIRVAPQNGNTNGETKIYDFTDTPLVFPNGIRVGTLTTANATLIIRDSGKGSN